MKKVIYKGYNNFEFIFMNILFKCFNKNESDIKEFDYEIEGNSVDIQEKILKKIMLDCIFINADKRYKIIYNKIANLIIKPKSNLDNELGIIEIENRKITKLKYDKKIVGYCLYGDNKKYTIGAIRNLEQYKKEYPDYKCYFYVRNDVPNNIIKELEDKGGIIIKTAYAPDWLMMFQRFLPYESELVKEFMSRDTDCRLIEREKYCLKEFNKQNKGFHIMRDHPYHNSLILGGMWGIKNKYDNELRFKIFNWSWKTCMYDKLPLGHDQQFLNKIIYPTILKDIYVHDVYFNFEKVGKHKIKCGRKNKEYIGEAYNYKDEPEDMNLRKVIK